jgi:hypothetical protein
VSFCHLYTHRHLFCPLLKKIYVVHLWLPKTDYGFLIRSKNSEIGRSWFLKTLWFGRISWQNHNILVHVRSLLKNHLVFRFRNRITQPNSASCAIHITVGHPGDLYGKGLRITHLIQLFRLFVEQLNAIESSIVAYISIFLSMLNRFNHVPTRPREI